MEQIPKKVEGGLDYWRNEIRLNGYSEQLSPFNDVITGKEAPLGYGEAVLRDVTLHGKTCDIYHSDKESSDTAHRVFIHIKS